MESDVVKSFRDLKVWRDSLNLVVQIYSASSSFPAEERFGLTAQIRKAAVSVSSNIAEGHQRDSTRDFLRHLSIARGSLGEVETQLEISEKLGYIDLSRKIPLQAVLNEVGRELSGLQKALKKRLS